MQKLGKKRKEHANAVFEGGGVKGIGIAGALSVACKYYDWDYLAGTSAGAIIAALIAGGYTAEEIQKSVFELDYTKFEDADSHGCFPVLGSLLNLKLKLGIYKGNYIKNWIKTKLKEKGVERFGDLVVRDTPKTSQGRYRLRVIASDISRGKMLILPQDISNYGVDPDYLEVAEVIRMSISIPFFFQPVALKYRSETGEQQVSYIVDGAVLSNFPVWLFDTEKQWDANPTFGFKLVGPKHGCPNKINGPISMFKSLVTTMMDAHDNRFIEEKNFERTIAIPTLDVSTTDFNISEKTKQELFQSGVNAAEKFFQGWDYQTYLLRHVK